MIKNVLILLISSCLYGQTVSTFFADPAIDVDDAMILDAKGNLYGSNFAGNSVYKITPGGVATTFATGLTNPNGLAFDTDSNLYVAEWGAGNIRKYDPAGSLLQTYNVTGTPSGLIYSNSGTIIFTNTTDHSINQLASDGTITTLHQGAPLDAPVGLTYDSNGILYIGNYTGREIYSYSGGALQYVATVPDGGATDTPNLGFITYGNNRLYGTILGGHKVYEINPLVIDDVSLYTGGVQGNDDGGIGLATFNYPNGIFYNPAENALYVSEYSGLGNIRKIEGILGTNEIKEIFEFVLSPNPSKNMVTVQFSQAITFSDGELELYDITGKLVRLERLNNNHPHILNVDYLKSGTYFIKITSNNSTSTRTFIKI